MSTCFGTLFDVAQGDIRPDEAGSASGSLSAVQRLAAVIGSAAITTAYFKTLAASGQAHAIKAASSYDRQDSPPRTPRRAASSEYSHKGHCSKTPVLV